MNPRRIVKKQKEAGSKTAKAGVKTKGSWKKKPDGIPADLSWLPCRVGSRASRHLSRHGLAPMPGHLPSQPTS